MVKIYSLLLFFSVFLISGLKGQAPVMNPISGSSVVCSPPSASPSYTASASNSPTSYSWTVLPSAGVTISNPTASVTAINYPTPNGTYTVVCYASNGSGTSSPVTFVVHVFETPNVTFSGATSFCQGSSTNIMASSTMVSASSTIFYNWSPPTGLNTTVGPFVSASPTTMTNYTVTATNGSCSNTGTITITPMPTPTISVSAPPAICPGDPVALFPSGAATYTINSSWTANLPIGSPFVPPFSAPYYIYGSNSFGCIGYTTTAIVVNPGPSFTVAANPPMSCFGQSVAVTFTTSGTTYSFNTVSLSTPSTVVSPTTTTNYTISATTSQGCKGSTVLTVISGCIGVFNPILSQTAALMAYPNPNAGTFNLSSGKNEFVRIVNEIGQLVRTVELKADEKISVSGLSPGVYFVTSSDTKIKIIVLE